jgi:hypothetical protein
MEDEAAALKDKISQMTDGELLRIVGPDRDDYVEQAIGFATRELRIRNIPFDEAPRRTAQASNDADDSTDAIDAIDTASSNSIPPCDACRGPMRSGSLFAGEELTMLFHDNDEERFVQVFACSVCGKMRMVVDFQTNIER